MSAATADDLWSAIGDPTRRRMLDLLVAHGKGTASSLGSSLPVTRQAVARHLAVLERVDLVHSSMEGRERIFRPTEAQLARAAQQLAAVGSSWDRRLARIAHIAEAAERQNHTGDEPHTTDRKEETR